MKLNTWLKFKLFGCNIQRDIVLQALQNFWAAKALSPCYIGKTKRRLHDRKTEHFKALTSSNHSSAIADHMTQTGHKIKWDHFDILATGQSDLNCKIKETLLIRDLKPALNENVGSEKLLLY